MSAVEEYITASSVLLAPKHRCETKPVAESCYVKDIFDWYYCNGKKLFISACKEHGIGVLKKDRQRWDQIAQAFLCNEPKDKRQYCKSHAELFLLAMDIFKCRYDYIQDDVVNWSGWFSLLQNAIFDSIHLLDSFKKTNSSINTQRSHIEVPATLYHAIESCIYGHTTSSFGLSVAATLLRCEIERRIRFGYGLIGIDRGDGQIDALNLSLIFKVLESKVGKSSAKKTDHSILVADIKHVSKIYNWTHQSVHASVRPFVWCVPVALDYLCPFLMGDHYITPDGEKAWSIHAGIQISHDALREVQAAVLKKVRENEEKAKLITRDLKDIHAIVF